jgi:hypothetical protein
VWTKAYPKRTKDPAEDPEYYTRFVAGLYPQYSKYLINEDQLPIKGILAAIDKKIEMEQKWRAYKQSKGKALKANGKITTVIEALATPTPTQTALLVPTTNLPLPISAIQLNTSGHLVVDCMY